MRTPSFRIIVALFAAAVLSAAPYALARDDGAREGSALQSPVLSNRTDTNHDILVLSNHGDPILGGEALVELIVPPGIVQAMREGNLKIKASLDR